VKNEGRTELDEGGAIRRFSPPETVEEETRRTTLYIEPVNGPRFGGQEFGRPTFDKKRTSV
jgi:hypothetical protein